MKAFGDFRVIWWDPQNPDRIMAGSDGGFNVSYDRGKTADHYVNLPVGEFYAVDADMEDPYNVYGGMQDHESWRGPSNSWSGAVNIADWITVGRVTGCTTASIPPTRDGCTTRRSSAITGGSIRRPGR